MSKKDTVIDYEKVLQHVGPLGIWQFLNLCVLFSVTLCGGIAVVTFAFAGKEIEIIHTVKSRAVDRSTIQFLTIFGVLLTEICY